jgi:hypothetical protein
MRIVSAMAYLAAEHGAQATSVSELVQSIDARR